MHLAVKIKNKARMGVIAGKCQNDVFNNFQFFFLVIAFS